MVDLADAQLEKLSKEPFVSVNANPTNFLMPTEIAILVELIKLSPMEFVSALLDTVSTAVEFALFHAAKDSSHSKEDVLSVPSTPSTKLKSTDVIVPQVTIRTSSEFVRNLP